MLDCRGATRRYGDRVALQDVSLTVAAGEVVAVLGPNGAGKSTLVRLCAGLIGMTAGSISVLGLDVGTQPDRVRENVGLVLGDAGFYDAMTLRSYLVFFARSYGMTRADAEDRVSDVLVQVALSDRARSRLGALSQGMRQKVSLVRALLHEPALLLLDEATNGLDPEAAARFRDEISALRSSNRAIVLCTHLLHEADELADRVVILQDGRAIADETPTGLKQAAPGALRLVAIDLLPSGGDPDIAALAALGAQDVALSDQRLTFRSADPTRINPQVVAFLVRGGHEVVQVTTQEQSLEAAYLSRVRPHGGAA